MAISPRSPAGICIQTRRPSLISPSACGGASVRNWPRTKRQPQTNSAMVAIADRMMIWTERPCTKPKMTPIAVRTSPAISPRSWSARPSAAWRLRARSSALLRLAGRGARGRVIGASDRRPGERAPPTTTATAGAIVLRSDWLTATRTKTATTTSSSADRSTVPPRPQRRSRWRWAAPPPTGRHRAFRVRSAPSMPRRPRASVGTSVRARGSRSLVACRITPRTTTAEDHEIQQRREIADVALDEAE